jgi:hypothetical protein
LNCRYCRVPSRHLGRPYGSGTIRHGFNISFKVLVAATTAAGFIETTAELHIGPAIHSLKMAVADGKKVSIKHQR